jgi:hypothetical protein
MGIARLAGGRDSGAHLGSAPAAAARSSRRPRRAVRRSLVGRARDGAVDRQRPDLGLARTVFATWRGARAFVGSARGARAGVGWRARSRRRTARRVAGHPVGAFLEPSARARLGRACSARGIGARRARGRRLGPATSGSAAGRATDRRSFLGRLAGRPFRWLGYSQDRRAGRAARAFLGISGISGIGGRAGRASRSSRPRA